MRAIRIDTDGTYEIVEGDVREGSFLREHIGCEWFEAVYLDNHSLVAWLDEEGKLTHKPSNHTASLLLAALDRNVGIVEGTMLITRRKGENNVDLVNADITNIVHRLDGIKALLADMDLGAERVRKDRKS
jgi:hypothetical protein